MSTRSITRRSFVAASAVAPLALSAAGGKNIPVGLELYSVRGELAKDLTATVTAVAKMGYQVVEFYSPYYAWTEDYAKTVRKLMDDLGIRCNSTHNDGRNLTAEGLPKAIELNQIIGSRYIVMASAGNPRGLDGWKGVAGTLTAASEKLKPLDMRAGYHNHDAEFRLVEGKMPIEVIAANTPKEVMLQFDVGTCVDVGYDPVKWIEANPGRIHCMHCKDWGAGTGADRGYRVLFGEGDAPWLKIFAAAERAGGIEWYLIEQEGSRFPELEGAKRCLDNYNKLRG
jgi:sugar phosphate isomerase/epimerase